MSDLLPIADTVPLMITTLEGFRDTHGVPAIELLDTLISYSDEGTREYEVFTETKKAWLEKYPDGE